MTPILYSSGNKLHHSAPCLSSGTAQLDSELSNNACKYIKGPTGYMRRYTGLMCYQKHVQDADNAGVVFGNMGQIATTHGRHRRHT